MGRARPAGDTHGLPLALIVLLCLASTPADAGRKLDVTFLFHANQNLVPYGKVGDRASFRGLLTTLRAHPSLKFQIHFSGTLIHDVMWFGDSTLQLIRDGTREGQFEIMGSTYVQNVMYSTRTDTGDYEFNDHQIKFHKGLIQKTLGVTPTAFWNPERVWTQNFVQLLADNGYRYTQVEDHILAASGAAPPVYRVRNTYFNTRELVVFEDDKQFLGLVDAAINSGDIGPVISFLHSKHAEDVTDTYVIGYYQDAEATGLWDYEARHDPQTNFQNLDKLLTALENDTLVSVTTYAEYLKTHTPTENLTPILDGAAAWMGGNAWFTENLDPRFEYMRSVYDSLRVYLNSVKAAIEVSSGNTVPAYALLRHAWFTLCAHQFEFGCHGLQNDVYHAQLQMARASAVVARAALESLAPTSRIEWSDINRDGVDEVVSVTPGSMFVISRYGGRMLYWFDLYRGEELVGNENFMADYIEPWVHDNKALPVLHGGIETYPWLAGNPVIPEILQWTFIVRKRALNDRLTVGSALPYSLDNELYTISLDGTSINASVEYGGVRLTKSLTPASDGVNVSYRLVSLLSSPVNVALEVENSFSPSYMQVMDRGREILTYWDGAAVYSQTVLPSTIGVMNTATLAFVCVDTDPSPDSQSGVEDVFGLELNQKYTRTLRPGDSVEFSLDLRDAWRSDVSPGDPAHPQAVELYQNFPNPFNPETLIRYNIPGTMGQGPGASDVRLVVYDILGREVEVLVDEPKAPGRYEVSFDARLPGGQASRLASGVYMYRLTVGTNSITRRMMFLK